MNTFFSGASYFFDGFGLIAKPGMKRFVFVPLMINLLLFLGFFFLLKHWLHEFNTWFSHFLPSWLTWLSGILWFLFFISFILLFLYTFVSLANLVAAPFNSFLAEKVEWYLTGVKTAPRSLWQNVQDVPRIVGRQCLIIGYYLPRACLLLILFFIPLLNTLAPFLWFLFNAWFLTFTFMDYPSDNHQVPLHEVKKWLKARRLGALGFGCCVLVVAMIPFINCLAMSAAVAGATKYWVRERGVR